MRPYRRGAHDARLEPVLGGETRAGACALSAGLRDVRSEHAIPGLAGSPSRRVMPVLPGADFLDAGLPGSVPDQVRAAVRSAETLGHPLTLAQTLCWVALVHIFRHEPSAPLLTVLSC